MRTNGLQTFDLNALRTFAAVAESGGFTAAATRLGTTKARVSLDVAKLERQLRQDLFTRTTRRVALTQAGRALYTECVPLLRKMDGFADQLRQDEQRLSGTLRLTATVEIASQSLATAVTRFAALHPDLRIELVTSDRVVNLVKEGIDVAIRIGWMRDSSLRATKLGEFEQYVVASPEYLARAGVPGKPEELQGHAWIALTRLATPLTWKFTGPGGDRRTVRVESRLRADTGAIVRSLLELGAGVSVLDSLSCAESLGAGRLKRLLSRWSLPMGGVYAVYPPGRHAAPAARAFVEHYRAMFRSAASASVAR